MTVKDGIGIVLIVAVFLLAIEKCQNEPKQQPNTEALTETREKDLKASDSLKVVHDSIMIDRWRTKTTYDTIIKEVLMYDSSETDQAFDSLLGNKNNAVVVFYKWRRDSSQLNLMDSAHVLDSLRIGHLTNANLLADSLLIEADKRAKKKFWQGFKVGFGSGYITAEIKNALIK